MHSQNQNSQTLPKSFKKQYKMCYNLINRKNNQQISIRLNRKNKVNKNK